MTNDSSELEIVVKDDSISEETSMSKKSRSEFFIIVSDSKNILSS